MTTLEKNIIKQNTKLYFESIIESILHSKDKNSKKTILLHVFSNHTPHEIKIFINNHVKIHSKLFTHILSQYDQTNFEFIIDHMISNISFQSIIDIVGEDLKNPILIKTLDYLYKKYQDLKNTDVTFYYKKIKFDNTYKDYIPTIIDHVKKLINFGQYSSNLFNIIALNIKHIFKDSGWNDPNAIPLINYFGKTLANTHKILSLQSFVNNDDNQNGLTNPSLFTYLTTNFNISIDRWDDYPAPGLISNSDLKSILNLTDFDPDCWENAIKKYHISRSINKQLTFYRNVALIFREFKSKCLRLKHITPKHIFKIPETLILYAWKPLDCYPTVIVETINLFNEMVEIYLDITDHNNFDIYTEDSNYNLSFLVSNLFNRENYLKIIGKYEYVINTFISQEIEVVYNNLHNIDSRCITDKFTILVHNNFQIAELFLQNIEKFVTIIPKFGNWFYKLIYQYNYDVISSINVHQIKSSLLFKSLFLGIFQKYMDDTNITQNIKHPHTLIKYIFDIRNIGLCISIKNTELLHIITIINNFLNKICKDFNINVQYYEGQTGSGVYSIMYIIKSWDSYIMTLGIDDTPEFSKYMEPIFKVLNYMYDNTNNYYPVQNFDSILESESLKNIITTFMKTNNNTGDNSRNEIDLLKNHYEYLIQKNEDQIDSKCITCIKNPREWLFEKCSHITSCTQCLNKILENTSTSKCPTCRQPVDIRNCRRVYIS
jgi:hypothetical protein